MANNEEPRRFLPRSVADAITARIPGQIADRVLEELTDEYVRLIHEGHQAQAEEFWREGVDRICAEVLDECRAAAAPHVVVL